MKTVWKYPLLMNDYQTVNLQLGAIERIVHVGIDPATNAPALWCEVDSGETRSVPTTLGVFGTGHAIPLDWRHLGSCITPGGIFVWHVYAAPRQ